MSAYRTGSHWGTTIIREGSAEPDGSGRRADDALVAVVTNGDLDLASLIARLLVEEAQAQELCDCGHQGLDPMFHLGSTCPVWVRWQAVRTVGGSP